MAAGDLILYGLMWGIPTALCIAGIFYIAYLAYDVRERRAEAAKKPLPSKHDYVEDLRKLNAKAAEELKEGRATLERARETLRKGIKG